LSGCVINNIDLRDFSTAKGVGRIMTPRFIAHGANGLDVSQAIKKLDARPTDNWVDVWSEIGRDYETKSQKEIDNNNMDDAKFLLLRAAVYYRIAGYPYPLDEPRKTAYLKSVKLFKQYIKLLDNPPQVISLSMETRKINGYFRKPTNSQKVPLVILLPNIDMTKEEMFWVEDHFLEKGFATFSMDTPGVGESEWSLRSDSERMLKKMLDYFKNDSSILSDKIVIVGFGMGGYWGLRLAAQDPSLAGVVAVDSPVHASFDRNRVTQMPRFLTEMFMKMTGAIDYQDMTDIVSGLSLKTKDILRDITVPVYVIGSENDILVPMEDQLLLSEELKRPVTMKLYKKQLFGIIDDLQSDVYPQISTWTERIFR
jgi:2,6-dihydroxypseudooxynicotine hydrolase